jgi:hypothetical protein
MLVNKISPTRQEACKYDNKRMKNTLECRKLMITMRRQCWKLHGPGLRIRIFFSNYAGELCIISLREKQYNEPCLKKNRLEEKNPNTHPKTDYKLAATR